MDQTSYYCACKLLLLLQLFSTLTAEHVPGSAHYPTAQPTCDQCNVAEVVTLEPAAPEAVVEQLLPEVDEHAAVPPVVAQQSSSAAPFQGTLLCYTGNLLPLALDIWALVRRLAARGHQVTCLVPDALAKELQAEDHVSVIHYGSVAFQEYQLDKKGAIHELTATLDFQLASCASVLQVGASQCHIIVTGNLAPGPPSYPFPYSRPSRTAPHATGHTAAHATNTNTSANPYNSFSQPNCTTPTTMSLHALLCCFPPSGTSRTSLSPHPFLLPPPPHPTPTPHNPCPPLCPTPPLSPAAQNRTIMDQLLHGAFNASLGPAADPCPGLLADGLGVQRRAAYDDGAAVPLLWGILMVRGSGWGHRGLAACHDAAEGCRHQ